MKKETQIALAVAVIVLVVIAIALLFVFTGGSSDNTASQPPPTPPDFDRDGGGLSPPSPSGGFTPPPPTTAAAQPSATRPQFTPRRDPFAPLPEEVAAMQADAFDPARYFVLASPPKPPRVELPEPFEPQPRRRVAGIIIGTTVSAILEQEGELPRIVYPGDMVGEFRVAAITETGLILRRSKGNPREVRVPYEPPGNVGGGGGGGAGFGGPRGGGPGAPGAGGLGAPGGGRGGRGGRDLDI
jgi:translation initiation factor IF-2